MLCPSPGRLQCVSARSIRPTQFPVRPGAGMQGPPAFLGADKRARCYSTGSTCIPTVVGFGFGAFFLFILLWFVGQSLLRRAVSLRWCLDDVSEPEERGQGQECARRGYLTFCSSCRSHEGSGCPSLCSSLDSSTLCSR